jgi:hypothetical protein
VALLVLEVLILNHPQVGVKAFRRFDLVFGFGSW